MFNDSCPLIICCLFQFQSQLSPCTEYNNQVSYPLPWKPNIPIEAIGKIIASLTSELYPIKLDHIIHLTHKVSYCLME